jgi:hypothetical protein
MALDSQSTFNSTFAPIKSAFGSTIQGILQGTTTLKQGMKNAFQSIALSYTQSLANMAMDEAAHWLWQLLGFETKEMAMVGHKVTSETAQSAATTTGETTRVAAKTAGVAEGYAVQTASALSSVAKNAAVAASGAFAATAAIPYVGPVLAPIAAATAYAATMMYAPLAASFGGEWDVPQDRLNLVHKNETILPATIAAPMREFFTNGGIGNVGLPEQATNNSNAGAGLAMTAASALATQQSLIQAQQQQQKQAASGTVVINTKGGDFIHKDDLAKMLVADKRNFKYAK